MAEIASQRNTTLVKLIGDVGGDLAALVRWPESEATKSKADNSVKLLRKALKEGGFPHCFTYTTMIQIAFSAYSEALDHKNVSTESLKAAWIKAADIL